MVAWETTDKTFGGEVRIIPHSTSRSRSGSLTPARPRAPAGTASGSTEQRGVRRAPRLRSPAPLRARRRSGGGAWPLAPPPAAAAACTRARRPQAAPVAPPGALAARVLPPPYKARGGRQRPSVLPAAEEERHPGRGGCSPGTRFFFPFVFHSRPLSPPLSGAGGAGSCGRPAGVEGEDGVERSPVAAPPPAAGPGAAGGGGAASRAWLRPRRWGAARRWGWDGGARFPAVPPPVGGAFGGGEGGGTGDALPGGTGVFASPGSVIYAREGKHSRLGCGGWEQPLSRFIHFSPSPSSAPHFKTPLSAPERIR